jgi:NADPH-dependent curcumin reductase CurA
MREINRQITLAARPTGFPKESDFRLVESPVAVPGPGQFLVRTIYLSVDPYMRGRMNDRPSYAPPVGLGEVMTGGIVGQVVQSKHAKFPEGTYVEGRLGWQDFAVSDGAGVRVVDPKIAPLSAYLGVLGMPGLTAYFGLLDIGQPKPGETVLVSGAAGAVGSAAGQIARLQGCRVVGVAGTDEKVRHVTEDLGFDSAFNYRGVENYVAKLQEVCPAGIDVYFDNVGGDLTDAAFQVMNVHARVAVCGQISQYNLDKPEPGPRLLWKLIEKRARVQGFLVLDYAARYKEGAAQLADWLRSGKLQYRETIVRGLENAPRAFLGLLQGQNIGKQIVEVRHSPNPNQEKATAA